MLDVKKKIEERNVVATTTTEGNSLLGFVFWYSVTSEAEVTRVELENQFKELDIDEAWLPNPIRPSDAFRRATKEIQRRKVQTSDPGKFQNFLVREVFSDNTAIQRNIVIETVDQSGKRLNYDAKAAVMTLTKDNNDFSISSEHNTARELANEAKQRFKKYIDYYSAQQIRIMINKYLSSLAPTPVRRNGGIYFIPKSFSKELNKLLLLCDFLQSEGVSIPLQDTSDNKNMVLSKLEYEIKDVLERCQELSTQDNLKKQLYKDGIEEARRIANIYKEYKENLSIDVEKLENMLNELRITAVNLTRKMMNN